jgi:uncharacterized RDD family membrane protein YckC
VILTSEEPRDDEYRLLTPENVEFSYDVAGLGTRFVAAMVDTLIQTVLFAVVAVSTLVAAGTTALLARLAGPSQPTLVAWIIGGGLLLLFLVLWGYYVFFELAWGGQSPGKRLVHVRVIREDGYPVGFLESMVRNLVRVVDFLPAYYVIGMTVMLLNPRAKRLGDLVAGTVVVKEQRFASVDQLVAPSRSRGEATRVLSARLAPREYALVREFLLRRGGLPNERRRALAGELALGLAERSGIDRDGLEDEAFLEALAEGYARR